MVAAPVNPSDYGRWRGAEEVIKPEPCGLEGSGVVVASGGGVLAGQLVGKSVGFMGASMAQYVVAPADMCMRLSTLTADGASWFINPFTAYGMYDTARSQGATAIVHTGAASQLGQMLVRLCLVKGLPLINVVRRREQAEILKKIGAEHVVVTGDHGWQETLKRLVNDTGPPTCPSAHLPHPQALSSVCDAGAHMAFDCVAGVSTKEMLAVLPVGSGVCFVYGRLSGEDASVPPIELIYGGKRVEGFLLVGSPRAWLAPGPDRIRRWQEASEAVCIGLQADGWARSHFVDCSLEDMFPKLLEMWAGKEANDGKGFTGQKLRIRL